ncbi:MAG: nuclear transport factor 2 family protein [Planctomycetota bacterium]|nr:nuclear transport factor 2 family protein [Planctomycetota bacterium]
MKKTTTGMIVGLALIGSATAASIEQRDARSIAEQYWKHIFEDRDLKAAAALMSDDVRYRDPTAGSIDQTFVDGLVGEDALAELQRDWDVKGLKFKIDMSFTSGEHACVAGGVSYRMDGKPGVKDLPFATILRIKDGAIIERTDYGDYTKSFTGPRVSPEPELETIARNYVHHYLQMKYREMASLLDEDAVFVDPTAAHVGQSVPVEGRSNMIDSFQHAIGVLSDIQFDPARSFFFQNHAVFAGQSHFVIAGSALGLPQERVAFKDVPLMIVLTIEGGKVVKHYDYTDYEGFQKQFDAIKDTDD